MKAVNKENKLCTIIKDTVPLPLFSLVQEGNGKGGLGEGGGGWVADLLAPLLVVVTVVCARCCGSITLTLTLTWGVVG